MEYRGELRRYFRCVRCGERTDEPGDPAMGGGFPNTASVAVGPLKLMVCPKCVAGLLEYLNLDPDYLVQRTRGVSRGC